MASTLIVDSGFWIALQHPQDRHHGRALQAAKLLQRYRPLTTWPVVTEASHLIARYLGATAMTRFIDLLSSGVVELVDLPAAALPRMGQLMQRYQGLPMDLADASLVWLADREGHGRILSTDERDFGAYRWKNTQPFRNLLLDPGAD